jgi:hypothetical protein
VAIDAAPTPDLELTNCAEVVATVFKNISELVQWEDDKGVRIADDQPAIRDALLSELRRLVNPVADRGSRKPPWRQRALGL